MRSRRDPPPPGAWANRQRQVAPYRPSTPPPSRSYSSSATSRSGFGIDWGRFIWPVVIGGGAVVAFALWQAKQGIVDIHNAPESEPGKVAVSIALPIAIIAVAVIILISIGRR